MNLPHSSDALTECDREPIHHIGAVQNFGGLIAADRDGRVVHLSVNVAELLGLERLPEPGTPIAAIFSAGACAMIEDALYGPAATDLPARRFGVDLTGENRLFDCALHRSDGLSVIEFEPHARGDFADHVSLIIPVIAQLETATGVAQLCDTAARLVRQMTGYDRVMVYRFHADDSGEVIAEDVVDDPAAPLDPYLGLRYPAADIPKQARELFRRNRFRIIADMDAPSVPIVPERGPGGEPLDLSMSVLRAHSQIHHVYMRNMGVGASLSIAIVRHDRLWGMISCHHRSPRLPAYSLRTVAELLSQTFSLMLDRILVAQAETLRDRARQLNDRVMLRLSGGVSLSDSLPMIEELLKGAIAHDGISLFAAGEYRAAGSAPEEAQFRALAPMLSTTLGGGTYATTRLADQLPGAATFAGRATGALILPLTRGTRDALVLWRAPLTRTVTWAGNPAKAVAKPGELLQPRASFAAWQQIVAGRSAEWTPEECEIAARLRRTLIEVILRMSEDLSRERARTSEQQDLLINELNHRVRNILGLIRALVAQSQAEAASVPGFAAIIGGRIAALATAHDNMTEKNWGPASLFRLIEAEFAPYGEDGQTRAAVDGEDVLVTPEAYTILALVIHELVTNSAKYGSLSMPAGRVGITLARNPFGDLALEWRETGGPAVTAPTRRGFGSTIITRSIPHDLQGGAEVRYEETGLEASFLIPARYLADPDPRDAAPALRPLAEPAPTPASAALAAKLPVSVLVVEDSVIIALDTEENLKRLGVAEVRIESSVDGALAAIAEGGWDFAILDFNLGGESSEPIAAALRAADVRFVLATGYSESAGQFQQLGAQAILRKPYGMTEIERLLIAG
ncbi:HWE histidine kinase domain-containing protein [Erythrobacter neustonensis]|uniref:histidine kinase n=1 Tax=Erythrobacter neustonensis TaxID=1112 RepID=A0A192D2E2_9SPHN|nr:HWE histidine kinase domain-containing protein [Erythrobacter neustonensis]ANK12653.1 histidine kinase [Erythrobacter neustonensis]